MAISVVAERIRYVINRIRERLWVKPMAVGLLSVGAALVARVADTTKLEEVVPRISAGSIETLLSIMASSMLVIATFAVASMVAAYSSASNTASPRSFALVIADDISQRALSTFIGAFIFSIVGLVAVTNEFYGAAGRFVLFAVTVMVFGLVVFMFVRWVDRIARLGRLANTIEKVEEATAAALRRRRDAPRLGGVRADTGRTSGQAVHASSAGYVQRIDVAELQSWAEEADGHVRVAVLPGSFVGPERPLAYIETEAGAADGSARERVAGAFLIGGQRVFDEDPRYGLIVLSQIAGRALSPAVNDPGTAIDIIGILVRLFALWASPIEGDDSEKVVYERVEVPALSTSDMFDDAFTAVTRDGSGSVEVMIRLQKALASLASLGDPSMTVAAYRHARRALESAEQALTLDEDLALVREHAGFANAGSRAGPQAP
jgi:uncharacterized membrane protein